MFANRFAAVFFIVFFLFSQTACSNSDKKKEKHYQRALEYIKIDDKKAASLELKNAIAIDAKFADARYQLGLIHLSNGDPRAAFGELQRTVSLDPKNLDAGVKVAEFYLLSRDKKESRRYVEQVLSYDPEYVDGLALIANLDLIEGKFDNADAAIDKALTKSPDKDKLHNIKGRIYLAKGKGEEAEKEFEKAIMLNPDYFANYRSLLLYYEQKKDDTAISNLLDTMAPRFPNNPQLHVMLAEIHQKRGETEKAEQAMIKAVESKKDSVSYRVLLTDFYKKQRNFEQAEATLKAAMIDFPEDTQLQVSLSDLLFELRRFDESRSLMDEVLAANPANGGANLMKARFFIKEGKNDEAIELITPLMNDYPKWPDPFYYAALAQLRTRKSELAQRSIEEALLNDPRNDRFRALAAQIHLVRGNSDEAVKEASIALKLNPQNFVAIKILSKSYVQGKEYEKAVKLINALEPKVVNNNAELLSSLSGAQLGLNKPEEAEKTLKKLLTIAPNNTKALALLAPLVAERDVDRGIDFIKSHIDKHPSSGHYMLLGNLYQRKNQFDDALIAFNKAKSLSPEAPQSYLVSGRLLARLGKTDEAMGVFQELLQQNPDSIGGLMGLASGYEKKGMMTEAKETYKRVLDIKPDLPTAANNLAWILAEEDNADLGEALRLAMLAKQSLPGQPHIADTLGWVHYKRGSYSLALSEFEHALENRPDDPTILYHLGLAQFGMGDTAAAIESLEKSLASEKPFTEKEEVKAKLSEWKAL